MLNMSKSLSPRTEAILKSIIEQYVARAAPVPSQSLLHNNGLDVSSATIRNEMMRLKQEGYLFSRILLPAASPPIRVTVIMSRHWMISACRLTSKG